MSDIQDFDADDVIQQEEGQQQAPPPVQQVNPAEVAHEVARILGHGQRMTQQAAPVRSAVEAEIESLVRQGYNAEALAVIARIRQAEKTDEAKQIYAHQQQLAHQNFQAEIWKNSLDIFEQYAEHIPALEDAKEGVLKRFYDIFHGDPEFKAEVIGIARGEKPTKKSLTKAMGKAVDVFCQKAGIQRSGTPLSLSTAKAAPSQRTNAGGSYDSLDHNQKKLYNALKGTLGEDKALTRAREMYSD